MNRTFSFLVDKRERQDKYQVGHLREARKQQREIACAFTVMQFFFYKPSSKETELLLLLQQLMNSGYFSTFWAADRGEG